MDKIVKETAKALLLKRDDGATYWIQRRWLRDDGSLTPAGDKARAKAQTKDEWVAKKTADERADCTFDREAFNECSPKCVVSVAELENPAQTITRKVYWPTSQMTENEDGTITFPAWLVKSKRDELLEFCRGKGAWINTLA